MFDTMTKIQIMDEVEILDLKLTSCASKTSRADL